MEEMSLKQPELIGREEELNKLKQSLDNAIAGDGSTTFISGEAGIGKTRLVSELIKDAESNNFRMIKGWCLTESLEPLMPIKSALREAGLFHLISGDPPPLVVSVYLMNDAGLLISKYERKELELDPHIFASMLTAVGNFVKDSIGMVDEKESAGGLNILGYNDYKILIEEYNGLYLASVTKGSLSELLASDMREILLEVYRTHGDILANWDGDLDKVKGAEGIVSQLITSGKYSGKFLVDDPKIRQENMFDNVLLGFQRLSNEQPLLLFMDDLHWVDPSTLTLLHYLARNTKANNVAIIGTYRPEDIVQSWDGKTHQLESKMQDMNREDLLDKIELNRLGPDDTERIIESALGNVSFDKKFFDKIYKETEGTPFFVLEVIKLLIEDGAIAKNEEEAWTLVTDLDKLDIPSKVYDVIKRRLDRLMKEQRDILECASIVGEEFHSGIIEKTIGINKIQLLKNLSEIEKVHNLIHYLSDKYRFDHAKIKEVLYNGIGGELRKEYHRIIADTIMEINKDGIDDVVSDLAYHYFEAGDEKAGEYSLRAGNQAKERFANEEAIRFYTNALEIINDDEKIKEINENMGDINSLIGEYENAMENYQSAIKRENDVRKKADLHRRIAIAYKDQDNVDARLEECEKGLELLKNDESIEKARLLGEKGWAIQTKTWSWKDLREFFHEELRIAEKFNDKKEIAQAHHNIGKLYHEKFTDDSMKEGISHFEKALAIQEDIEDTIELSKTLFEIGVLYHNRGFMYPNEGNWDKAIEYYNRSMKIKQKIGDKYGIAWILYCIAVLHRDNDELDKALKLFEDCLEIHKKIGKKSGITQALYGMGYIYSLTGELDKALDYYEQSYEVIKQTEQELMTAAFLIDTGEIYETMGELDKALEIYDQCIDLCESSETDNKGQLEYILRLKGNVYKHKGELDNALKYHKTSFEMNSRENTPFQERRLINNHSGLAEIYIKQGNIEEAKKHAGKALDISKEIDSVHHKRISYQALAMVSREEGNWTRSMEYFEKAKETLDNDPQGVYVLKEHRSRLSYEYGLLFKAMGEPDKAKEHLDKALKGYTELSHKLWADKVQKALEELAS